MAEQMSSSSDDFHELSPAPDEYGPTVPIVMPQRRYSGSRNIATIKDGKISSVSIYLCTELVSFK